MRAFDLRAANACLYAMESDNLCERHIRDVLKCREVDASRFEKFISSKDRFIRMGAMRVIALHGDSSKLVDAALDEEDRAVLLDIISLITDTCDGLHRLSSMLLSGDELVRDESIELLRRTGQVDALLPLIFNKDDVLVERVKRYMNE